MYKAEKLNALDGKWITVSSCGAQDYKYGTGMVLRPHGTGDYHLLYVKDGKSRCIYKGEESVLEAGDFVVYEPYARHEYAFDMTSECKTYWLHFNGESVADIVEDFEITPGVHKSVVNSATNAAFDTLIMEFSESSDIHPFAINLLVINLFVRLARDLSADELNELPKDIAAVVQVINLNPEKPYFAEELAKYCGLSVSRFEHKFSECVGMPPLKYQTTVKISRAKNLLKHTALNVSDISESLGFCTPVYFTKMFRKYTGKMPLDFRLNNIRE